MDCFQSDKGKKGRRGEGVGGCNGGGAAWSTAVAISVEEGEEEKKGKKMMT